MRKNPKNACDQCGRKFGLVRKVIHFCLVEYHFCSRSCKAEFLRILTLERERRLRFLDWLNGRPCT